MKSVATSIAIPVLVKSMLRETGSGTFGEACGIIEPAGLEATCTVRVDVALPFAANVVCGGTKPQFMPDGAPEQTKVT
jgi:hypothetical protein